MESAGRILKINLVGGLNSSIFGTAARGMDQWTNVANFMH